LRPHAALVALLVALVLGLASSAAAGAETLINVRADHLVFYWDRYLLEGDGHVRVTTSDGMTITGDDFSMDLKLDRFLVAGDVHLRSPGGNLDGAAISDFLAFKRVYFVPVLSEPDRWTYLNNDFKTPLKGREMPGDTFYFPNLTGAKPDIKARSATIGEKSFIRFRRVTSYIFNAGIPLPSFYIYFGIDQDLAQNSLSGANLDATWNVAGNNNYISALHARYDPANGPYLSFEQHFVSKNAYAVFSDNPATKQRHFWNLVTGERLGSRFQIHTFSQLYEDQKWLKQPYASSSVNYIFATQAFRQSSLSATAILTNFMLVPGQDSIVDHPTQLQLTASTFTHRIGKTPFYESFNYGIGFNHDSNTIGLPYGNPLQNYGGYVYTTIWNHSYGYTLYLPGLKFGNLDYSYKTYYFNASMNYNRTWYSVPHNVSSTFTTASVSRQFSRQVNAYVSYSVNNTGDFYNHGGYSPFLPFNNPAFSSFLAFRGVATLRTATLGVTYSTNPNFLTTLTFDHHDDFPISVPGLFAQSPLNNIGQPIYTNYLGQPPNDISADVRARILPHLVVDVSRTYYFHFGTLGWSPQFVVQFSQ
jgi:hypothetical protein